MKFSNAMILLGLSATLGIGGRTAPDASPVPPPESGPLRAAPAARNIEVAPPTADGITRIALIIGNSGYTHVSRLENPSHDARMIADTLKRLGFELVNGKPLLDLDKSAMDKALEEFGKRLSRNQGAVGMLYYAGHGMQVDGANYLIPIDANPTKASDLNRQALNADHVLQEMQDAGTRLNVVVLDACRNNPFGGLGQRGGGRGLAQMQAPKGTLIAYATQPGNVAQDGPSGENSPFASALGTSLRQPGLKLFDTFNNVGVLVMRATQEEQQPWVSNSPIEGTFCFAGCEGGVATVLPPPVTYAPPVQPEPPPEPVRPPHASAPDRMLVSVTAEGETDLLDEVTRTSFEKRLLGKFKNLFATGHGLDLQVTLDLSERANPANNFIKLEAKVYIEGSINNGEGYYDEFYKQFSGYIRGDENRTKKLLMKDLLSEIYEHITLDNSKLVQAIEEY